MEGKYDKEISQVVGDAIRHALGADDINKRFIDASRIPLICADINGIHKEIGDIKNDIKDIGDNFKWITRLILGFVVLALLAVIIKQT